MLALVESILGFFLILSFLVIIHELGHFTAAKLFGVKIEEFGLGYPPKVKDLFKWKGTVFTLNWLPFGGFVRLLGENREGQEEKQKLSSTVKADSVIFYEKPAWQRIIILAAGAAMNFLFGIVAFSIMFTILGIPETRPLSEGILVTSISLDSPASESDLRPGDIITLVTAGESQIPIDSSQSFIDMTKDYGGQTVELSVKRQDIGQDPEYLTTNVYVRTADEIPVGDGSVGIGITADNVEFVSYPAWQMPFRGAWVGLVSAFDFGVAILLGLGTMIAGIFSGLIPSDVTGPVGIASEVYKQRLFQGGLMPVLNFSAIISINLAVVNLLPIPALDGGRIVTLFLEKIFGKAFKPIYEQYANAAGFFVLLSLIILITIKDIGAVASDAGYGWEFIKGLLGR